MSNAERTETNEADLAATLQGRGDGIENGIDGLGGVGFGKLRAVGNGCYEIVLIQRKSPLYLV